MSNKLFSTTITAIGAERLANAALTGTPLAITDMGVGDGSGWQLLASSGRTGLVNEKYRAPLNKLSISDQAANVIEAEMIIPPQFGGFWLRDLALYSDDGECLAIGNMPDTYKPLLAEGSARYQVVRMQLQISSTADVRMIADPSVILATHESVQAAEDAAKDYADDQLSEHEHTRNHPDATLTEKGFTKLSSEIDSDSDMLAATPAAIKAAIAAAVRQAWELSNPKGISLFFFENVNPNSLWPWSTWEYTGEDRTVRIAKQDGSNVGKFGGSDSVTITRANLPNEQLNISGGTSQQAAQTITAKPAGKHKHKGGMSGPGDAWDPDYVVGSDNDSHRTRNYTSEDGDHGHDVDIPAHVHTVSGTTDALGQGQAISIVEKHVLQMCWHRVA